MSLFPIPEMAKSIDQVIQDGQTLPPAPDSHYSHSNVGTSKTTPLPPLLASPSNPRREHVALSMQSNSQAWQDERRAPSRVQEKDGGSNKKLSTRQGGKGSSGNKSGNTTTLSGSGTGVGTQNDITDFFSSEVFQIVLHNPTTAHRFLRFCQSRDCGENMEFLQKVRVVSVSPCFDRISQSGTPDVPFFEGPGHPQLSWPRS
jgi:phototropin